MRNRCHPLSLSLLSSQTHSTQDVPLSVRNPQTTVSLTHGTSCKGCMCGARKRMCRFPLRSLCEVCCFKKIMGFKHHSNLQLWFPAQTFLCSSKPLQAFLVLVCKVLCKLFDDGLFDVLSHPQCDTSAKMYLFIIKYSPAVGLRGGCLVAVV